MSVDLAQTRRRADLAGRITALLVAIAGAAVVIVPALWSKDARQEAFGNPFRDREPAKIVTTTAADGTTTVETTWSRESSLEQAVSGGAGLLLRIGIVAAAAFLAGAAAQRAAMAHFSLELGPVKLPDLPSVQPTSEAVIILRDRVEELGHRIGSVIDSSTRAFRGLAEQDRGLEDRISQVLDQHSDALATLRRDLDRLREGRQPPEPPARPRRPNGPGAKGRGAGPTS